MRRRGGLILAAVGACSAVVAAGINPGEARLALSQDWPPFVLVTGLLLVGAVAQADGIFQASGSVLSRVMPMGWMLFAGSMLLVAVTSAFLNLDTAVAFLTPVFVYASRDRPASMPGLLIGCILMSNAASMSLPGSNLTNLIVVGHLNLTGGQFLARMWAPSIAAVVITAAVVGVHEHSGLKEKFETAIVKQPIKGGTGIVAVALAGVAVIIFRSPAAPVVAIGIAAAAFAVTSRKLEARKAVEVLGIPVLVGLFGISIALGTLGRTWSVPGAMLSHLDPWATVTVAAASSVAVNNLPSASLLAAHVPGHPFAMIVGLDLGPNIFVTGSLSWILWLHAARNVGERPSITRSSRVGAVASILSMAAALGIMSLTGLR